MLHSLTLLIPSFRGLAFEQAVPLDSLVDGEKCWIVPFDAFEALRQAVSTLPHVEEAAAVPGGALEKAFSDLHADQQLICGSADYHNGYTDALKAAELYFEQEPLTASEAVGTVPREPTEAMLDAADRTSTKLRAHLRAIWIAMWDAAQSPAPALAGENVEAVAEALWERELDASG